jgi:hypothetical protein
MSLADGGVPVEDLSQGYPEADWDTVLGDMFLEQNLRPLYATTFQAAAAYTRTSRSSLFADLSSATSRS